MNEYAISTECKEEERARYLNIVIPLLEKESDYRTNIADQLSMDTFTSRHADVLGVFAEELDNDVENIKDLIYRYKTELRAMGQEVPDEELTLFSEYLETLADDAEEL